MAGRPKMAMSSDFLDAFARLPKPQQRGVRTLISRFNADSTAGGLNYERIHAARSRGRFVVVDPPAAGATACRRAGRP